MNFKNLRVTDIKDCPRVQLPASRKPEEEMVFKAKETLWSLRFANYMAKNCDDKGRIKLDNMKEQRDEVITNS